MVIGFDVAQTCAERAGCAWYADSLIRAMVKHAPENKYILYHHFSQWINESTTSGTYISHPSVEMPMWNLEPAAAAEVWSPSNQDRALPGSPELVQSNSFQVISSSAKLVFVVYDVSFWIYPEFTTEANRRVCQAGVLQALQRADGFLFISESGRREFDTILPGWLERTGKPAAAIPLASRFTRPNEHAVATEDFWLTVGAFEPRKNYDALFTAIDLYWRRSSRPKPVWIAAATGWKNEKTHMTALRLEAEGRVRFLGYVSDTELQQLYERTLALIFPSWYEGFGLPILEAMQCGCAVICSAQTSLPEVGGDAPLYIRPDDPGTICEAMLALEQDTADRERRRQRGLERARQFTWERTARATLDFYREVLAS